MIDLLKLQNGSDIRGVAAEGVADEPVTLTEDAVNLIGQAFVQWLSDKSGKPATELKIGVGHDSRITADLMKDAFIAGASAAGANLYYCGLVSTPSMFMTVVFPEFAFDGSVMITASHLPFNRNGLKFFNLNGGLEKADIKEILTIAKTLEVADCNKPAIECDSLSAYTKSLQEKIKAGVNAEDYEKPLKGLRIVVDAGNGAGGFFVEKVLAPLGADTTGSQFLEPDGTFPNHIPNPENKQAMEAIKQAVLANNADLGIIFDTDVDRMSAVLPDGSEVNRDAIVTDSVTSDRLTDFLENELKLVHHRFKRGYKNVINESIRLNESGVVSPLAIETSGHGALSENYFLDDGAYLAVTILIATALAAKEGKKISSYIENLAKGFDEREFRMKIFTEDFAAYGQEVLKAFEARAKEAGIDVAPNSYEGVRLSFHSEDVQGWLLLRMSLHDPLMPMNMEGVREGDCEKMLEIVKELLTGFDKLDI